MRRIKIMIISLVVISGIIACVSLVRKEDKVRFSHKKHVVDQEITCDDCHAEIKNSKDTTTTALPKEKTCLECHDKSEDKCGQCHTNPKKPESWSHKKITSVIFSHKNHLERTDGSCDVCHKEVRNADTTHQTDTPRMLEICMSCHRQDFRAIDCKKCHEDLLENPIRPTRLFSHDAMFMKRHGEMAKGDERVCSHCHRDTFCADCHSKNEILTPPMKMREKVTRDLVHRGDFMTRHAIEASADPNQCLKCHTTRQCESCHEQMKVAYGKSGRSYHPTGWMSPGSSSFHGDQARRDIVLCASCHEQGEASNCITCHKVGGVGGRPHPKGMTPKGDKDHRMCRTCHGKQ